MGLALPDVRPHRPNPSSVMFVQMQDNDKQAQTLCASATWPGERHSFAPLRSNKETSNNVASLLCKIREAPWEII